MEEKPSATSSTDAAAAASNAAESPASSTRRRGGAQKRKASSMLSTSSPSPTPSKRLTREKAAAAAAISYLSPIHNGPQTRARQSPGNFNTSAAEEKKGAGEGVKGSASVSALEEERIKVEELEKEIEMDFEGIRSRDSNAHIVPNHCGWFSWTKIHPLEEHALPSFFDGKSQTRTPDTYLEIRNWIAKKFHVNPNLQIESKDLSESEVGDSDAKQEVFDFLDYWGLINFHPFPQLDSADTANPDEEAEKDSLLEKLFRFEDLQPSLPSVPKPNVTAPAAQSGLFPDSAINEELAKLEEPSVDYHCNSCSADCSHKRYHCQTQADYDLCADCFNDGKFGASMSSSDFILMESAEAPGETSGNWTDQETLLLLEAVELFSENWNEIAEHVATKTKAQCILHFVQMPIEDVFFVSDGDIGDGSKETAEVADDMSAVKVGPETIESKPVEEKDPPSTSALENSKPGDASDANVSPEVTKTDNGGEALVTEETLNSNDNGQVKTVQKKDGDIAVTALTEAFEAVGYLPTPDNRLSFADVGNPVMALAGFLARFGGPDVVTASTHCSLKSLNSSSPGVQLAARHCFVLEDPPNDGKELVVNSSSEMADQDAQKDGLDKNQKGTFTSSVSVATGLSNDHADEKNEKSDPKEQKLVNTSNDKLTQIVSDKNGVGAADSGVNPGGSTESTNLETVKDRRPSNGKESDGISSRSSLKKGARKADNSKVAKVSKDKDLTAEESKDEDMPPNSLPSEKNEPETTAEDLQDGNIKKLDKREVKDDNSIDKIKQAAVSALSAAAVKAKLLANEEEEQIRQLAASLIEKQLHKLETKLAFFHEMDGIFMRVRDQLDRSRQRLQQERQQIIMARFSQQASSSRAMAPAIPGNRPPMNFANMVPRPPPNMGSPRPPIHRPMMMGKMTPLPSSPLMPTTTAGSSISPSGGDQISSAVTK